MDESTSLPGGHLLDQPWGVLVAGQINMLAWIWLHNDDDDHDDDDDHHHHHHHHDYYDNDDDDDDDDDNNHDDDDDDNNNIELNWIEIYFEAKNNTIIVVFATSGLVCSQRL